MNITKRWFLLLLAVFGLCPVAFALIDRDNDGMSDLYTDLYPDIAEEPDEDEDKDSRSNHDESVAGTDPTDPFSVFGAFLTKDGNGQVVVVWPDVPGKSYTVEESMELVQDSWTEVEGTPYLSGNFWYYETGWPPEEEMLLLAGPPLETPVLESTADGPEAASRFSRVTRPLQRYDLEISDFGNGLAAFQWFEHQPQEAIAAIRQRQAVLPPLGYDTYRLLTNLDVSVLPPEGIFRDRQYGYEVRFRVIRPSWLLFDLTFEISWHYDLNRVFGFGYAWQNYFNEEGLFSAEMMREDVTARRRAVRFYEAPFADIPHGGYEYLGAAQNQFLRWMQLFLENNREAVAAMNPPLMLMLTSERRELAETGDINTDDNRLFWRVRVGDQDTDGDGLTDWEEYELGLDPDDPDEDADGLLDGFEIFYWDDFDETASGDPDGDGLSNRDEMELGTDPTASDAGGKTLTYGHNAAGWLTSVSGPDIAGTYTYDAEGNVNPAP